MPVFSSYLGANVLITGASRGIGLSLVEHVAADYPEVARIFAAARDPAGAKALGELAKNHDRIKLVQLDVASDESIKAAVQQVEKEVGAEGLGLLINNAGIKAENEAGSPQKPNRNGVLHVYNVNVLGPAVTTAAFLPLLHKAAVASGRPSKVLNISSGLGSRVINKDALMNDFAYCSSKSALNMYTHILSVSERELITLSMCPGWIRTDLGGPQAPLSLDESIPTILKTIAAAKPEDSGKYVHRDGQEIVA